MTEAVKRVYAFGKDANGNNVTEGNTEMKWVLGGKGANLAEMANIGLPVPPGFTITCQTCMEYANAGNVWPEGALDTIAEYRADLEERMGKRLGDAEDPLLVSVRSGAPFSMPGMMDTVLNLGLNDESINGLIKQTDNPRFAWDSYRRFIQMFSNVVMGLDGDLFENAIVAMKNDRGVASDTDLTAEDLQELVDEVGSDAARYTLISKSSNQMVDFDIEAVKKRDNSNPVYYVQYAHARVCSILRRAADVTPEQADEMGMKAVAAKAIGENVDYSLLTDPTELALSRKLNELTDLIASCARDRAPFRLTHFAEELAGDFHSFYAACQVLPSEGRPVDPELSRARLAACDAVRVTLALVLTLVGVSAPEQM